MLRNIISTRRSLFPRSFPSRNIQTNSLRGPPLAFAFDIDGVLMAGPNPISGANRALKILEGENPFKMKIPYILLTNGGGYTEQARAAKLSRQLGIEISPQQVIQAHTILKESVRKYADVPVLVLGGKGTELREVAQSYGFHKVYTSVDVLASNPSIQPFVSLTPADMSSTVPINLSTTPISAVFVFHDPRNWFNDVQILLDIVQCGGVIGGPYIESNTNPIEVIFCNPDLIWKSEFPQPRLGQGAFREAFQAVYKALNGTTYPHVVQYGKPTPATYNFAEKTLRELFEEIYGSSKSPFEVYMIGDNPESDIAGANAANWSSVLVHTGVFTKGSTPRHTPTHQAPNVEEAVRLAIQKEAAMLGRA